MVGVATVKAMCREKKRPPRLSLNVFTNIQAVDTYVLPTGHLIKWHPERRRKPVCSRSMTTLLDT